ncbi:hypothetical protein BOVAC1_327 [Bacteroides ovatus]|nr:hypothetical protein BOVAC1_327 [Bacteroides ovatus]
MLLAIEVSGFLSLSLFGDMDSAKNGLSCFLGVSWRQKVCERSE